MHTNKRKVRTESEFIFYCRSRPAFQRPEGKEKKKRADTKQKESKKGKENGLVLYYLYKSIVNIS